MTASSLAPVVISKDEEHLRLLSIFHYVVAGISAFCACIPLIHVGLGLMMVLRPDFMGGGRNGAPPAWFGFIFIVVGGVFILLGWTAAICTFISGRYLAKRRKRMFSFVMAAILCMFMPFGTVLGIFTIVVLSRESVQRLYQATNSPA
ncbi:MAG TPA: hypothetical protein VMZ27_05110 [Candidatus Saccharimonadales bacterium]|nr:hypothetical protein [Candidatus Saccharimonadales bacterium]